MALWFHQDANFNVTSVSNDAAGGNGGVAVERYIYAAYGERTVLDSSFTPIAGNASRLALDEGRQGVRPSASSAIPDGCGGSSARAGRTGTIWTRPVFLPATADCSVHEDQRMGG
jgi:hypothetical protein